jgi:cell division protein ZapA (FtsZ GTPase activity inhibitor)
MITPLSEIYDLFMMTVTDYRLTELYSTSKSDFEIFLQAWLMFAINDFYVCDQSLEFDENTKNFSVELSQENKVILATIMAKYWLQKLVRDVTQMNLHVTDRDFKLASEAQNLREKINALNAVKEECSQLLIDYSYRKVEWADWLNQDFSGGV